MSINVSSATSAIPVQQAISGATRVDLTGPGAFAEFATRLAPEIVSVAKSHGDVAARAMVDAVDKLMNNGTIAVPVPPPTNVPHINENFKAQAIDGFFTDVRALCRKGGMSEEQLDKVFGDLGIGQPPLSFGLPPA